MAGLEGRRLLLTRSAEDAADWARALAAEGAEPIVFPCMRTETLADPALGPRLAAALASADWLVVTSRRGVDALLDLDVAIPPDVRLAAVGEATAKRLDESFGRVDHIGSGTAADLGRELVSVSAVGDGARCLPAIRDGARCVLALAANAGTALERALLAAGAGIERFDVYRTLAAEPIEPRHALSSLGCDTIIFASPSAVAGFDNLVDVDTARQMVTIGPSTSAAVRERRWDVTAESKEPSLNGIIESLMETAHV